jgi:uncharacterized protein with FMN-binding domain
MRRALAAFAATVIGVYWLVTFKVTAAPVDVPVVSVPSPRVTTAPGRAPVPTARATNPPATAGVSGGTAFTGPTVETLFGPVQVQIALSGRTIIDVQALQLPSDRSRSARILRSEAIQAQSARVDIVSGATYTSRAYAQSLASALKQAGQ